MRIFDDFNLDHKRNARNTSIYDYNCMGYALDAYCVGISEMRVEKDLCQGDYVSIYKNIIISTRSLECQAKEQQDRVWVVQLKRTRMYYQTELLKALTSTIQNFCMEN